MQRIIEWFTSNNTIIRLINVSLKKQLFFLVFLLITLVIFILFVHYSLYQKQELLNKNIKEYSYQLTHHQKIVTTLKEKQQSQLLTPEIGGELVPINKYINNMLDKQLELIFSQWEMHEFPVLTLKFQGYFSKLHLFLTALLTQFPKLQLSDLNIQKLEHDNQEFSIQADILLILDIKAGLQ